MAKLCMGCMNPLPEGNVTCTVCGFTLGQDKNPEHCLPVTASLQGHYIVGRLVGESSDHLLYLAYDRQLREPCFIQEFFPAAIGRRDSIGGVQPMSGCERVFEEYAGRFRQNMRTLARMRDLPAVVPVYDIFEENGTVYAASDYCEGMTLTRKIKLYGGRIPWPEARMLFMPLLSALTDLNNAGILHLAICPDNILVGADGKARLRSFSIPAVHQAGTDLPPNLKSGYAAPEQYVVDGEVDAYTDVYGMAATIFRTVTGNEPPSGDRRARSSDDLFMSSEVAQELTQPVCVALFNALQVQAAKRTATMDLLREQLALTPTVSALVDEAEEDIERDNAAEKPPVKKKKTALGFILGILIGLIVAAGVAVWFVSSMNGGQTQEEPTSTTTTTLPTLSTTATTERNPNKVVVDNVIGLNYYDLRDKELSGNMTLELEAMQFSEKPAGAILSQEPAAKEKTEKGATIKVVISMGQEGEEMEVPDVSGWQQEHAEKYLRALGFRVNILKIQVSEYERGIVDGTDPKAGTKKRMGDTITLRVSDVEPTTTTTTESTAVETEGSETDVADATEATEAAGATEATEPVVDAEPTM